MNNRLYEGKLLKEFKRMRLNDRIMELVESDLSLLTMLCELAHEERCRILLSVLEEDYRNQRLSVDPISNRFHQILYYYSKGGRRVKVRVVRDDLYGLLKLYLRLCLKAFEHIPSNINEYDRIKLQQAFKRVKDVVESYSKIVKEYGQCDTSSLECLLFSLQSKFNELNRINVEARRP